MNGPPPPYAEPPVKTVSDAVARMDVIQSYIDEHEPAGSSDGVGCFNALYRVITNRVLESIDSGFFADGRFLTELDVAFANRYLDALRRNAAAAPAPKSWSALIKRRSSSDIASIQFATAGVNAHINFDLAQALLTACQVLGGSLDSGTRGADYLKINEIFAEEMESLRHRFESSLERVVDQGALARVLNTVGGFSVEGARDAAWGNAEILWTMRRFGLPNGGYLAHLDGMVGLAGNLILTPVM